MKYKNLYEYLEMTLSGIPHPTNAQIKKAKRDYWKLWFKQYHHERRKIKKEFTLGFSRETLQLIKQSKGTLSVSKFLYQAVEKALTNDTFSFENKDIMNTVSHNLMELINLIEELLDNNQNVLTEDVLERIEVLECEFNQFKNKTA